MKIWLHRTIALALISLGTAMAFFPYNTERSGSKDLPVVYLIKEDLLSKNEVEAIMPGSVIFEFTGEKLNPDVYAKLWEIFMNLGDGWEKDSSHVAEWSDFQNKALNGEEADRLVLFRESLVRCQIPSTNEENTQAYFSYLGRFNPHVIELSEKQLKKYPNILRATEDLTAIVDQNRALKAIPSKEWDKMLRRYLTPFDDYQQFLYKGKYYGPEFGYEYIIREGSIPFLLSALRVLGALALISGFLMIRRLYVHKGGIAVNPRKIAILYDVITLLFAVPSAYMLVNFLLEKVSYIPPFFEDDYLEFMGIFFFLFGIAFVSLYTSRFTSQFVIIDANGIRLKSMSGKEIITWSELESLAFSDEYVAVGRVGVPIPRQLQKRLVFITKSGLEVIINEPQLKSVKHKILERFDQYMPDHLKDELFEMLLKW